MKHIKKTLDNGLNVVLVPMESSPSVTVLVLVRAGSRYESKSVPGISHFVEHIMFKGTEKRPTTLDLSRTLDSVGADYNAYTGKDHTGYYVKINADKVDLALDVLSDMLIHSKFESEEIKRESEVIVEEIKMYEDNPLMYIDDLFEQTIFNGNILGDTIAGTKESVRGTSREDMMKYMADRYQGEKMTICLAGNVDDSIMASVEKYFGQFPGSIDKINKEPKIFDFPNFDVNQKEIQYKTLDKLTEQVQMIMGFPGYSYFEDQLPALKLFSIILGGSMSSRLFIKVREKMGLCYFIKAGADIYQDTGNFNVHVGLDAVNIEKALTAICQEFKDVKSNSVTSEELQRAKDFVAGKLALKLENTANVAVFWGNQDLLEKKIKSPQEKLDELNKVTQEDIAKVANKLIVQDKANIALIGKELKTEEIIKHIQV